MPVDLLTSGIFSSHYINTVSPRFLTEIVEGWHEVVPDSVRNELRNKYNAGCSTGILNAPDISYNPYTDDALEQNYNELDVMQGKAVNKSTLQKRLHLNQDPDAAIFFWPSRLDPVQKGPQLLAEILHQVVSDYWDRNLQVVFVANGPYQQWFEKIVSDFNLYDRVAVIDFDEQLSRLAYAGSDYIIMPSLFEPCGLPQMTAPLYGTLPVVHSTGGLYDTIHPLNVSESKGNGFRFDHYTSAGLRWAMDEAMAFHTLPTSLREREIRRVMCESVKQFSHKEVARRYINIYEEMLERPLVEKESGEVIQAIAQGLQIPMTQAPVMKEERVAELV